MAKKNRSSEPEEESGSPVSFKISKTKIGKQKLITVTFQLSEIHEAHLNMVADQNEVARAELCKQAVATCLQALGAPFPDASEVTEELREYLESLRSKRAARAAKMEGGDDEGEDE